MSAFLRRTQSASRRANVPVPWCHHQDARAHRSFHLPKSMSANVGEKLRTLLQTLRGDEERWMQGDNLALLDVDDDLLQKLGDAASRGLEQFSNLTRQDQARWGAVMLVAGAHALRRAGERPRTYATIGSVLGIVDLAAKCRGDRLDAMQAGAGEHLEIELVRSAKARWFVETMLANSGIDMRVFEVCAAAIRRGWSWSRVALASLDDVDTFIEVRSGGFQLSKGLTALLANAEGRRAVADRLIQLSRLRNEVIERGLLRPTFSDTRDAIVSAGLTPKSLLGAEPTETLFSELFDFAKGKDDEGASVPRWLWSTGEGTYGLVLGLPLRMELAFVPPDVDRVRVLAIDAGGILVGRAEREAVYTRSGDTFRRISPWSVLPVREGADLPIDLLARFGSGAEDVEHHYRRFELPGAPVTLLNAGSGEVVPSVPPGATAILLVSQGWSVATPPITWTRLQGMVVEAWRAEVPTTASSVLFRGPAGEEEVWSFGGPPPLRLKVEGDAVEGLRYARIPAFRRWPEFRILGSARRANVEISGPNGQARSERRSLRSGRFSVPPFPGAGLFKITATAEGQTTQARFVVLPPGICFEVSQHEQEGATTVMATVTGEGVALTPTAAGSTVTGGSIRFPPGTRGKQRIGVAGPGSLLEGLWEPFIEPEEVRLIDVNNVLLDPPWDLAACDASAHFIISGRAGSQLRIETCGRTFTRYLSAEGTRQVRLTELPDDVMQLETAQLEVSWLDPSKNSARRREFRIRNARLARPQIRLEGNRVLLQSPRLLPEPVEIEVLPVWRPWDPYVRVSAALARCDDKDFYAGTLPAEHGQFMVGLVSGGRPATGLALATLPNEPPDLSNPVSALLWDKKPDQERLVSALRAQDSALVLDIATRVERYGAVFFQIAKALPRAAGRSLLCRLAQEPGTALDCALWRLVQRGPLAGSLGPGRMVVRYADLDAAAESLADDQSRALDALDELASWQAGLVTTALSRWPLPFQGARFEEIIALWAHLDHGKPLPLKPAEIELIGTPDDESIDTQSIVAKLGPRARGLFQVRKATAGDLGERCRRELQKLDVNLGAWADSSYQRLLERVDGLPLDVLDFEQTVFFATRALHRGWRSDGSQFGDCLKVNALWRYAPALVDYWLNYWGCVQTT